MGGINKKRYNLGYLFFSYKKLRIKKGCGFTLHWRSRIQQKVLENQQTLKCMMKENSKDKFTIYQQSTSTQYRKIDHNARFVQNFPVLCHPLILRQIQ